MGTYSGTPRTWSAGETLTAALMNSDVRDPLSALAGAWNSYTPTLSGFTAGNGTTTGQYIRVGKFVVFRTTFTFGTTSAAASAAPSLTLPITAVASSGGLMWSMFYVNSTAYLAFPRQTSTTAVTLYIPGSSGAATNCSTSTPNTWGTGSTISLAGIYEAA